MSMVGQEQVHVSVNCIGEPRYVVIDKNRGDILGRVRYRTNNPAHARTKLALGGQGVGAAWVIRPLAAHLGRPPDPGDIAWWVELEEV